MSAEAPLPTPHENDPYAFVPFSEQTGTSRIHRIRLHIDFSEYTPPSPEQSRNIPGLQAIRSDYEFGWGDIDHLAIVVPDTPMLRQETPEGPADSIEGAVLLEIKQRGRAILRSIESEQREDLQALAEFLPTSDIAKISDFINNRRGIVFPVEIPDAVLEQFPPEERDQIHFEIESVTQDFIRRRARRRNKK